LQLQIVSVLMGSSDRQFQKICRSRGDEAPGRGEDIRTEALRGMSAETGIVHRTSSLNSGRYTLKRMRKAGFWPLAGLVEALMSAEAFGCPTPPTTGEPTAEPDRRHSDEVVHAARGDDGGLRSHPANRQPWRVQGPVTLTEEISVVCGSVALSTVTPVPPTAVLMMRNIGVDGTSWVREYVLLPSISQVSDPGAQTRV
jgi:hypothetical protein